MLVLAVVGLVRQAETGLDEVGDLVAAAAGVLLRPESDDTADAVPVELRERGGEGADVRGVTVGVEVWVEDG